MIKELKKIIEQEAEKHAYHKDKPMTTFERVMAYQGFIAGAEFILKRSNYSKPKKKKDTTNA